MVSRWQTDVLAEVIRPAMGSGREEREPARIDRDLITATTRAKVRRFMLQELQESGFREDFPDDESLLETQILDSLSILKLLSFLDEVYGIFLGEEEIEPERFESVNRIVELILKKRFSK